MDWLIIAIVCIAIIMFFFGYQTGDHERDFSNRKD